MISSINTVQLPPQYPTAPQDDAALQRKKRSIEEPQSRQGRQEADGSTQKPRNRSGGLDSLGGGNLL